MLHDRRGFLWHKIRELDTFAAGIAEKNKARLDQIKRDREELVHINLQIKTTSNKWEYSSALC